MPYMPEADKRNKKVANYRAARKAGVKPGTRTIQDDGTLGGGVKLPPRKPTIPRPTASPVSTPRPMGPGGGNSTLPTPAPGSTPPYANLPNAPRPRGPGVYGDSPVGNPNVMTKPLQVPGQTPPVFNPITGGGREAGKADMIGNAQMGGVMNQMAPYDGPMPGSGGIYAGGQTAIGGPVPYGGGGSQGFDGGGPMDQMPPDVGPITQSPPGMEQWLQQGNIPKRFGGDLQAAMSFMQGNPQSRMAQAFGGGRGLRPQNPIMSMLPVGMGG